jgi:hypothetical protein
MSATWTTQVDPSTVKHAGQQISAAATPVHEQVGSLAGVKVTQPGFQTADELTKLCSDWATSLTNLASALTSIGAKVSASGIVYEVQESWAGRMFRAID